MNCFGAGKNSLITAVREVFGSEGRMNMVDFQGKTDPLILHESLESMGLGKEDIQEKTDHLKKRYFYHLEKNMNIYDSELLPGVKELLDSLSGENDIVTALLTGNFKESAEIKLSKYDLNGYFSFGVFGDDAPVRNGLPPIAREILRNRFELDIPYENMIIIGDTIYDVECARNVGAVSIAVGTGIGDSEKVKQMNPDYYFDNLRDTEAVLGAIKK